MKYLLLLTFAAASLSAQTAGMRQVYLLPMAGGLDQYLADWLTRGHVMQVVTDPKAADVILTDRIGSAFEAKLAELYPPPPPPQKDDDKDKDKDEKAAKKEGGSGAATHHDFRPTGARGTIFLVDTKSHLVVWSDHERPVEATDRRLNRQAERIVRKLQPKTSQQ